MSALVVNVVVIIVTCIAPSVVVSFPVTVASMPSRSDCSGCGQEVVCSVPRTGCTTRQVLRDYSYNGRDDRFDRNYAGWPPADDRSGGCSEGGGGDDDGWSGSDDSTEKKAADNKSKWWKLLWTALERMDGHGKRRQPVKTILRPPTTYRYVIGMSGFPSKVPVYPKRVW